MSFNSGDEEACQGVVGRRMKLCPWLKNYDYGDLIRICGDCDQYGMLCCQHAHENMSEFDRQGLHWDLDVYQATSKSCHNFRLIFTDGACKNNGISIPDVTKFAGIGVAMSDHIAGLDHGGNGRALQWCLPLWNSPDHTNQRSELLAAIAGVVTIMRFALVNENASEAKGDLIVATDSEYVVKGITEWMPNWRARNWKTSKSQIPANIDLFLALDMTVSRAELWTRGKIGFWHVPREYNTVADILAKRAASEAAMIPSAYTRSQSPLVDAISDVVKDIVGMKLASSQDIDTWYQSSRAQFS